MKKRSIWVYPQPLPPAVAVFVKAAAERGDTLLPYYGIYRLARCLFKANEEIAASTMNSVTSRF
jgi:hypothetical protein